MGPRIGVFLWVLIAGFLPSAVATDSAAASACSGSRTFVSVDSADHATRSFSTRIRDRRPTVCRRGRLVVRLPRLRGAEVIRRGRPVRTGERLENVALNGRWVAWRTSWAGRRGVLSVGRVRAGRPVAVRRTPMPRLAEHDGPGHLVLGADGATFWLLCARSHRRDGVHVWLPGARPTTVARGRELGGLHVIDDRTLVAEAADGLRLVAYRPPQPGTCPRLERGRWRPLADLQVARIRGVTRLSDDARLQLLVACDPTSGRDLVVEGFIADSDGGTTPGYVIRSGALLITEPVSSGRYYGITRVRDLASGQVWSAEGGVVPPGVVPPDTGTKVSKGHYWTTAVVAKPGAVGWFESGGDANDRRIWLSDAAGTRVVGHRDDAKFFLWSGQPPVFRGLRFQADRLAWDTPMAETVAVPVIATADSPFGVLDFR